MTCARTWAGPYLRLLGIGLPLTIALGTLLALALFTGTNIWLALLIGAALAPTDAALGAGMTDVESGLNDGIATPFVLVAVAGRGADRPQAAPSLGATCRPPLACCSSLRRWQNVLFAVAVLGHPDPRWSIASPAGVAAIHRDAGSRRVCPRDRSRRGRPREGGPFVRLPCLRPSELRAWRC